MTTDRVSGELLLRWISVFRVPRACLLFCLCASSTTGVCAAPQTITCSTPQSIAPASTQGGAIGKLTIDPTQLDIKVFDSATASLSVVNQASPNIQKLSLSVLGLSDGKTGQSIPATAWEADFDAKAPLNLNQRTDCALTLPLSNHAGAFTGTLRIDANGFEATLPLTIRIRGPYFPDGRNWPLFFLTLVFALGWGISVALDHWYTSSLPLVQQVILLKEAQQAMANFLAALRDWEGTNKITLLKTDAAVAFDKSDLDSLLLAVRSKTVADLQLAVQRFTVSSALNDEFYTALQIAKQKSPGGLSTVAAQLDNVPRGQDIAAYRTALLQVLTGPLPPNAVATTPSFTTAVDLSKATAASLHKRVVLMDYAKSCVLAVVVWSTAYTLYFTPNPSFGTALDYLTLFLWCLGLTATGSQIVSSVRKP